MERGRRAAQTDTSGDAPRAYAGRGLLRRLARRTRRRPLRSAAFVLAAGLAGMIAVNAGFLQPGPHPAPLFVKAAPSAPRQVADAPEDEGGFTPPSGRARIAELTAGPSPLVASTQEKLAALGFYDGPADGVLTPQTVTAIRDFEVASGLEETGRPSLPLLAALAAAETGGRPLAVGSAPADDRALRVRAVQAALERRGFGPLAVDGIMGPATAAAIRAFERRAGLPETGTVTPALLRALDLADPAEG